MTDQPDFLDSLEKFLTKHKLLVGGAFFVLVLIVMVPVIIGFIFEVKANGSDPGVLATSLKYSAIFLVLICLTIGIVAMLLMTLQKTTATSDLSMLNFALKYIAIAIIANAAFMLGILNTGEKDFLDKVITLYAGIAGYVLGSMGQREGGQK